MTHRDIPRKPLVSGGVPILFILCYSFLTRLYVIVRFMGNRLDDDAIALYWFSRQVLVDGRITTGRKAYVGGFGFQSTTTWLVHLTGLELGTLQFYVYPLLGLGVVFVSYVFFLRCLQSRKMALLAAFVVALQPEILFTTTRGSHELFTQPLVLVCFWFLWLLTFERCPAAVLGFYAILFGLIAYNMLFGASVVLILAMAVTLGIVGMRGDAVGLRLRSSFDTVVGSAVLWFTVIFYVYKPAREYVASFQGLFESLRLVLSSFGSTAIETPYEYIGQTWESPIIWPVLSTVTLVVLPVSLFYSIYLGYAALRQGLSGIGRELKLLVILYFVILALSLASIISDLGGGDISNLQVRVLPILIQPAAGLAVSGFLTFHARWLKNRIPNRRIIAAALPFVAVLAILPTLKTTNEPVLSKHWLFYTEGERVSAGWVRSHLAQDRLWTGPGGRYAWMLNLEGSEPLERGKADTDVVERGTAYVAMSDLVRLHTLKTNLPLPDVLEASTIYDNGDVQIHWFAVDHLDETR